MSALKITYSSLAKPQCSAQFVNTTSSILFQVVKLHWFLRVFTLVCSGANPQGSARNVSAAIINHPQIYIIFMVGIYHQDMVALPFPYFY